MPRDPFIREKFIKERTAAKRRAEEYFGRFPKDRYQTEVESWRELQSQNIEFTMKRLREPIDNVACLANLAGVNSPSRMARRYCSRRDFAAGLKQVHHHQCPQGQMPGLKPTKNGSA